MGREDAGPEEEQDVVRTTCVSYQTLSQGRKAMPDPNSEPGCQNPNASSACQYEG